MPSKNSFILLTYLDHQDFFSTAPQNAHFFNDLSLVSKQVIHWRYLCLIRLAGILLQIYLPKFAVKYTLFLMQSAINPCRSLRLVLLKLRTSDFTPAFLYRRTHYTNDIGGLFIRTGIAKRLFLSCKTLYANLIESRKICQWISGINKRIIRVNAFVS
jgi:hypothetical protein